MQQTKLLIDDFCVTFVLFYLDYLHLPHLSISLIASDVLHIFVSKTQYFWSSPYPSSPVLVVACLAQFIFCKTLGSVVLVPLALG